MSVETIISLTRPEETIIERIKSSAKDKAAIEQDLAKIMVDADMREAGLEPIGEGDKILKKHFPNKWWKVDQVI